MTSAAARIGGAMAAVAFLAVSACGGEAGNPDTNSSQPQEVAEATDPPASSSIAPPTTVAVEVTPPSTGTVSPWSTAATAIGGDLESHAFATEDGVVVLHVQNWGGEVTGELWDPVTNSAEEIGATGLRWRANPAVAWTGQEVLMVGGSNGPGIDRLAVAYEPIEDSWRDLAPPPGPIDAWENSIVGPGFWVGDGFVIPRNGLRYDLGADQWDSIASWPLGDRIRPVLVGAGDHILAWGGCDGQRCDERNTSLLSDGALYDAVADEWLLLPQSPLPAAVHAVAAPRRDPASGETTEVVIVVTAAGSSSPAAAAFDIETRTWRELPAPRRPPLRDGAVHVHENSVILWGGFSLASGKALASGEILVGAAAAWSDMPTAPQDSGFRPVMLPVGERVYVTAARGSTPVGASPTPLILELADLTAAEPPSGTAPG